MAETKMKMTMEKLLGILIEDRIEVIVDRLHKNSEYARVEKAKDILFKKIRTLGAEETALREHLFDLEDVLISISAIELETAYLQGIQDCRENNIITGIIERTV